MRVPALIRRLPWLTTLLVGCDDGSSVGGESESSTSDATTSMTSNADDSTTGDNTSTGDDTTTGDNTSTGDNTTTGGGDSTNTGTTGDTTDNTTAGDTTAGDTESNSAPTAVDDAVYTAQDAALILGAADGVLGNDIDPDGDSLTVTSSDPVSASGASIVIGGDGALAYGPVAGFWGPDTFQYTVEDDSGAAATATVTVHVAPLQVPLTEVAAGMGGFVLNGEADNDYSGWSVSGAGDVNGDGMDDVIVGAPRASLHGPFSYSGRSYVVFGKADTTPVELSAITSGVGGFVLDAEAADDDSGFSVSNAGDVNGDGMHDLIVGARHADPNGDSSGRSYVVFGKADTAAVELSTVAAGMGGFVLSGEAAEDRSGFSVSGAGDINGDGMDDLIVGAHDADPNGNSSGRSYVVFGKVDFAAVQLSAIEAGTGGFVLNGEAAEDRSGISVSGAGDVNGDGLDDLLIGADAADPNGTFSGRSYVVFGKADTTAVELTTITAGVGGFVLEGEAIVDQAGITVSGAGDVNGDGMHDLIVGAPYSDQNGPQSGRSYVVFGKADTTAVELSAVTAGVGGFALDGEGTFQFAGFSVSGAGDVNGDGMADIILGASDGSPLSQAGRSYVVFGKADTAPIPLGDIAAGVGGFSLDGEFSWEFSGRSVSGAGDVNGDGTSDIIIGAAGASPAGIGSGRSYVVFGVPTGGN